MLTNATSIVFSSKCMNFFRVKCYFKKQMTIIFKYCAFGWINKSTKYIKTFCVCVILLKNIYIWKRDPSHEFQFIFDFCLFKWKGKKPVYNFFFLHILGFQEFSGWLLGWHKGKDRSEYTRMIESKWHTSYRKNIWSIFGGKRR